MVRGETDEGRLNDQVSELETLRNERETLRVEREIAEQQVCVWRGYATRIGKLV